jgi:diguanylate cyclase (GGDEF)-like protein
VKREKRAQYAYGAPSHRALPTWVLVIGAVALFVILSGVYLGTNQLQAAIPAFLISEAAFIAPIIGSTVAGWVAHKRSSEAEARFWLLLTSANAIMVLSELYYIYWVVFVDIKGPPPVFAPFQLMHAMAAVLIFSTLMSMTKFQNATASMRVRWGFDIASGVVIVYLGIYEFVVKPLFARIPHSAVETVFGAAYPTWGIAMLLGTLATLLGFKMSRWRPWERLVALSLCMYAAGIAAWPLWLVTFRTAGASLERGVLDIVLLLGHFLLFTATIARLRGASQQWPMRPMPLFQPVRNRALAAAMPTLTLIVLPLATYMALREGPGSLDFIVYLAGTTALALVIVARSTVVAAENGRLFHRAATDAVTGLFNLRFMHERLAVEVEVARRYGEQLSLVVLDIDDFERVNDLYGHPAGDELLRDFGALLKASCRDSDIVCRIGGDEFAAILPNAGSLEALKVSLRVQHQLARVKSREGAGLTASIGLATCPEHATTADDLVRFAQGARYWVKRHGKDHVLVYDPVVVAELDDDDRIRALEQQSHVGAVRALAAAVDARDPATQDHSRNVAVLAVQVARELGLDDARVRLLESAALMHDVGKIGVPDDVLRKPGPLTPEERKRVSEHPALGERILSSTSQREMLPWVRHHHEFWDGTGYPDHLRAVEIPLEARILAVCDAFDAMISDRPYRPALSIDAALVEIESCMGTQFDPSVVEVFLRTMGRDFTGV